MAVKKHTSLDRVLGRLDTLDSVNLANLVQRLARERGLFEEIFNVLQEGVLVISSDGAIDYAQVEALAREHRPKLIICGGSAYSRQIDFKRFREIADKVGVHVTTVSRAVDDKWIQTPRGIFPLKRFFCGGTVSADGQALGSGKHHYHGCFPEIDNKTLGQTRTVASAFLISTPLGRQFRPLFRFSFLGNVFKFLFSSPICLRHVCYPI